MWAGGILFDPLRSDRPRFIKGLIRSDCSALLCVTNVYVDVKGSRRKRFESFFLRTLVVFPWNFGGFEQSLDIPCFSASTKRVSIKRFLGSWRRASPEPITGQHTLSSIVSSGDSKLMSSSARSICVCVCVCVGACRGWCRAPGGSRIPACNTS